MIKKGGINKGAMALPDKADTPIYSFVEAFETKKDSVIRRRNKPKENRMVDVLTIDSLGSSKKEKGFLTQGGYKPTQSSKEVKEIPTEQVAIDTLKEPLEVTGIVSDMLNKASKKTDVTQELSRKQIRVSLEGSFGKYRGKYTDVVLDGNLIILCYNPEESIFTPPKDLESIVTISYLDKCYEGVFPGIEFILDNHNIGIQVFIKKSKE